MSANILLPTEDLRSCFEKTEVLPVCISGLRTQSQNASHASRGDPKGVNVRYPC